jgi:hypothetical protein
VPDRFLTYAQFDERFASWMRQVSSLCERFLGDNWWGIVYGVEEQCWTDPFSPRDFYEEDMSPALYLITIVLPYLREWNGENCIDQYFAERAKWGTIDDS